jgi:hypothetical protein
VAMILSPLVMQLVITDAIRSYAPTARPCRH